MYKSYIAMLRSFIITVLCTFLFELNTIKLCQPRLEIAIVAIRLCVVAGFDNVPQKVQRVERSLCVVTGFDTVAQRVQRVERSL